MNKVFLYLYPIEEYMKMFLFYDDELYDEWSVKRPLPILNECIQKRYRDKGYKVVFVVYPHKNIFGIDVDSSDRIIYTDITFDENSAIDENKNIKKNFIPKYPNEELILAQLGEVDKLVIGGFHYSDCVRKVAEKALVLNIPTIIDLDMTDLFFNLYRQDKYFKIDEYSPQRYKEYMIKKMMEYGEMTEIFERNYASPAYGFNSSENVRKK